jgi:hypothetical protein
MPSPALSKAIAASVEALCIRVRASRSSPWVKQRVRCAKANWAAFSAHASVKSLAVVAT